MSSVPGADLSCISSSHILTYNMWITAPSPNRQCKLHAPSTHTEQTTCTQYTQTVQITAPSTHTDSANYMHPVHKQRKLHAPSTHTDSAKYTESTGGQHPVLNACLIPWKTDLLANVVLLVMHGIYFILDILNQFLNYEQWAIMLVLKDSVFSYIL